MTTLFDLYYTNGLNKASNAAFSNSGKLDISNLDIQIGTNLFRNMMGIDYTDALYMFIGAFLSTISDNANITIMMANTLHSSQHQFLDHPLTSSITLLIQILHSP